jgi:non-ribosomal peptide synthase protein (TIGR01720 family)
VTCGGEVLTADLEDRFSARLGAALVNLYGPTETSVDATFHVCDPGTRRGIVPIGRPIGGVRVHILDECLRPVPEGIPGELCVGGEGVARGYLNRPDLTAERFVPDPWAASPGARLYRTGDRARWAAGGTIEFLGRTDHQVKIRGFRVELEEIEAALAGHPQIAACAAAAREEAPGELRLAAYVVPREGAAIAAGELRRWLKARLPDHMVPAAFVEMAALPLTPSGKVDLGALPAPGGARPAVEAAYVGPRTPAEEALARIWAGALGLDRVGVHDDFFELGGDSILAIQVVARARDAGLRLTPRQVFQNPTIAGLASVAGAARHASAEQGIVRGEVPLTPVQGWFFERGLPDPHHWNQPVLLDLRTPIEPAALERALQHLLVHHDALRLRFARGGRGWRQFHAGPEAGVPFTHVDLTSLPPGASRAALEARAAREQAGLDLAKGPLVRVALFELPAGARRLLIVAHHLVVDAVSWGVILADLEAAYRQLLDGDPVELPLKTTSFKDWAERLAAHAASGRLADEAAYWIDAARRGAPALPVDDPGGRNTEAAGARLTAALDAARSRALLGEAPSAYRMEAQEIVLAALARSLARWTGDSRVFLEIEGHGREPLFEDVDLSRTVGWFTSLHPVHLDLPGSGGPAALLKAVKEQLRAVPGRGIGYGLLRHLDGDGRVQEALRKAPQPQVAVNYLGRLDGALPRDAGFAWASEPAGPVYAPAGERSHLIEVNAGMTRGRLEVEWSYGAAVHRRATIEGLARSFTEELAALVDHCLSPEAGGYTPSDFPEAGLDQMELDALMARLGGGPRP